MEPISGSGVSIKLTRDGNVYGGNVSFPSFAFIFPVDKPG